MTVPKLDDKGRMADIPLSPEAKITVERRGPIILIGVNRPHVYNRFDPDTCFGLAKAYYDFGNDPSLRAAVFFGHGEDFSRGIDVDAFAPLARTGEPFAVKDGMLDPCARIQHLSKPPGRGCPRRYLEHGPRTAPGGRHPGRQRRCAVRPGREHARPVPWWRIGHPVSAGSGMGKRHARHADR